MKKSRYIFPKPMLECIIQPMSLGQKWRGDKNRQKGEGHKQRIVISAKSSQRSPLLSDNKSKLTHLSQPYCNQKCRFTVIPQKSHEPQNDKPFDEKNNNGKPC